MFIIQCPILWYAKVCALPSTHSSFILKSLKVCNSSSQKTNKSTESSQLITRNEGTFAVFAGEMTSVINGRSKYYKSIHGLIISASIFCFSSSEHVLDGPGLQHPLPAPQHHSGCETSKVLPQDGHGGRLRWVSTLNIYFRLCKNRYVIRVGSQYKRCFYSLLMFAGPPLLSTASYSLPSFWCHI